MHKFQPRTLWYSARSEAAISAVLSSSSWLRYLESMLRYSFTDRSDLARCTPWRTVERLPLAMSCNAKYGLHLSA